MMTVKISSTGDVFPLLQYVRKIEQKIKKEERKKNRIKRKR